MTAFIDIKVSQFFDRARVVLRMDAKTLAVMSRTGFFGRREMSNGMKSGGKSGTRTKKTYSKPGEFPRYHQGAKGGLKGNILYAWDASNRSVVIGPRLFPRPSRIRLAGVETIPQLLNQGGVETTLSNPSVAKARNNNRSTKFRRNRRTRPNATRTFRIAPRPFVALIYPKTRARMLELMASIKL